MKVRDIEIRDEYTHDLLFVAKGVKSYSDAFKQYNDHKRKNKIFGPSEYYARNKKLNK